MKKQLTLKLESSDTQFIVGSYGSLLFQFILYCVGISLFEEEGKEFSGEELVGIIGIIGACFLTIFCLVIHLCQDSIEFSIGTGLIVYLVQTGLMVVGTALLCNLIPFLSMIVLYLTTILLIFFVISCFLAMGGQIEGRRLDEPKYYIFFIVPSWIILGVLSVLLITTQADKWLLVILVCFGIMVISLLMMSSMPDMQ